MKEKIFIDYSHEVRMLDSKLLRGALIAVASFFLVLGFIGIVTPVLPTTPFILLSALCFARSSPRFYNWMMNHRLMGPPLRDWMNSGSIKPKSKLIAISMLVLTLTPSTMFFVPLPAVKILLAVIGLSVISYIVTRPNPPQN